MSTHPLHDASASAMVLVLKTLRSAAHEAQLIRLKELLDQKANIEAAMEAKLEALRSSYDAHSRDLESVLSTRIMELN